MFVFLFMGAERGYGNTIFCDDVQTGRKLFNLGVSDMPGTKVKVDVSPKLPDQSEAMGLKENSLIAKHNIAGEAIIEAKEVVLSARKSARIEIRKIAESKMAQHVFFRTLAPDNHTSKQRKKMQDAGEQIDGYTAAEILYSLHKVDKNRW